MHDIPKKHTAALLLIGPMIGPSSSENSDTRRRLPRNLDKLKSYPEKNKKFHIYERLRLVPPFPSLK